MTTLQPMRTANICQVFHQAARLGVFALGALCASVYLSAPALALEPANSDLDTLFYTPAERADIIRARQPQSGTLLFGTVQRLTGVVRRGDGKSTVWVNGKAQQEGNPKTPQVQGVDAVVEGKRLRVGESVDPLTGVRGDVVAPGAVTVQHPK